MRKKLVFLLLFVFTFTACGAPASNNPMPTPKDDGQKTATPLPLPSNTSIPPTPTNLPPTEIPPSPTPEPRVERVEDFANITIDETDNAKNKATFEALFPNKMTLEQCIELGNEPPVVPIVFDDKTDQVQVGGAIGGPGSASISIGTTLGGNLFFQHAVSCDIGDGVYQHNLLFKAVVNGVDGHNKLVSLMINFDPTNDIYIPLKLKSIRELSSGRYFAINIILQSKTYESWTEYPLYRSLVGDDPVRENLRKHMVIDENTGTVALHFGGYIGR